MPAPTTRAPESWLCLLDDAPERSARVAHGWTPRISVEPGAVLAEVGGSHRLFGGLDKLRAEVERLQRPYALAPTPRAALWLARGAPGAWIGSPSRLAGALAALPLTVLGLEADAVERLHGFGLRTLGEAARLPRAALARRIGRELDAMLARALGERPEPRRAWCPPVRFDAARDFDFDVVSADALCRALAPLFAELAGALRSADRGVRRCLVTFRHRDLPPTRLRLGVLDPVRDTARLEAQLALHLERTPLCAPAIAVSLHASRLEQVEGSSHDLFMKRGGESWRMLLERLQARLGADALYRLAVHDDHRPERAFVKRTPAGEMPDTHPVTRSRPVWLLAEPRPVDPAGFDLVSGPERIESGWWDGDDVARDYFVARAHGGTRAWLYRERREPYRWFVHGLFG